LLKNFLTISASQRLGKGDHDEKDFVSGEDASEAATVGQSVMNRRALTAVILLTLALLMVHYRSTGKVRAAVSAPVSASVVAKPLSYDWPPKLNQPYPDLELIDQTGARVKLSSFRGRVVLLEPVGMTCPMCQQFAGAGKYGAFPDGPKTGVQSLEEWIPQNSGGLSRDDSRYVYIQLLLFNMNMQGPTPEDARAWAKHFHMDRSKDRIVLAGGPDYLQPRYYQASYDLIPGLQLIDKKGILRWDATGHQPKHSWWRDLLPQLPVLMKE
jgi:hypothetical protein